MGGTFDPPGDWPSISQSLSDWPPIIAGEHLLANINLKALLAIALFIQLLVLCSGR